MGQIPSSGQDGNEGKEAGQDKLDTLLHLLAFPDALVQFLHHPNKGRIFGPEGRIIPLLLNQECRDADLFGGWREGRQSFCTSPEFFVAGVVMTGSLAGRV